MRRSFDGSAEKLLLLVAILLASLFATHAQSIPSSTDAAKLKLDQEKFAYEKSQSNRNLILGFVLTTAGGSYITWLLGTRTWNRQTKIDLYRQRVEEGTAFLDTFSQAVGERYFLMQRLLWMLGDQDAKRLERLEKEYFRCVVHWNSTYWFNRNKIRLLVSDEQANAFLDYQDDFRPDQPQSLHYLFVKAHREVLKTKAGNISRSEAQATVDNLNWACSAYLENLTTSFLDRTTSIQLLQAPSAAVSSLKAGIRHRPGQSIPPRLWGRLGGTEELDNHSKQQSDRSV